MKIRIDEKLCVGYGVCESVNDELFVVEGRGPAQAVVAEVPAELLGDARHAVESCPTGALTLED